ncbi:type II secretion system protein GspG [Mariniblastus fucicola]|uniref:Type II secretion system protein G n=1 Tax=Mariniblastus fucicola TaxID=980251 RepID=A0A5B9PBN5_9BACT|nr:type II secretion system protein GspG [Mariniblastus fucicola]QEG22440.1 Type II secretion system protein G precursor [Mariniblastus fucicola]
MKFKTMVRQAHRRGNRKGFTLLELLLVMAILVVLAGLGTVAYTRLGTASNIKACKVQIKEIKDLCVAYKLQMQTYPRSLQDLVVLPSGMTQAEWGGPYFRDAKIPKDPWRNEFTYSANEAQDRVFVSSNGPDGAKGTADDIPGNNDQ